MKKHFLSFGGGSEDYRQACAVVCDQAKAMGLFDMVHTMTDIDLHGVAHRDFCEKFEKFIFENKRGYGFWIWKSYLVKWLIDQLDDGDLLIYADAGCRLSDSRRMQSLIEFVSSNDFLFHKLWHTHRPYTSQRALKELDINNTIADQRMIAAGFFAFVVTGTSRSLVNDWCEICQRTELLIDPNRELEPSGFIDHRHDQALLSLTLYAKYAALIAREANHILDSAILLLRLRSQKTDYDIDKIIRQIDYSEPLQHDEFSTVTLSSHSISTDNVSDLVTLKFKGDFSFSTQAEMRPSMTVVFKQKRIIRSIVDRVFKTTFTRGLSYGPSKGLSKNDRIKETQGAYG